VELSIRFNQTRQGAPELKCERATRAGETVLERLNDEDRADPARLSQTALEQVTANVEFRDIVAFLTEVRYLHIVPQLVRDPERSVGKRNDPYGGDFLDQIAETKQPTRDKRFRQVLGALKVAVPYLQDLQLHTDERGVRHLRGRYEHWRPHGAWQSEADFSDGTMRLLGLLWPLWTDPARSCSKSLSCRYIPRSSATYRRCSLAASVRLDGRSW